MNNNLLKRVFSYLFTYDISPQRKTCPVSSTNSNVAFVGVFIYLLLSYVVFEYRPFGKSILGSLLFIALFTFLSMALIDVFKNKVYLRESTGLDFNYKDRSWSRSCYKYLGLLGSLGFIGFFYWLFPEYSDTFYRNYFRFLILAVPFLLLCALPYIYIIDSHMPNPYDGYWHMANVVLLRWHLVDPKLISQHLLGWIVKGFFLPLMFTFMFDKIGMLFTLSQKGNIDFLWFYDMSIGFLYFIDVGIATIAYVFTLRIIDTHLRSSEPTLYGWVVALICYPPMWTLLFSNKYYLHASDNNWRYWLSDSPFGLAIWGSIIIILTAIYVWATVVFGMRFSNLTNRGIITNGPYSYTKHPAYIAKNLSWWLMSVPFLGLNLHDNILKYSLFMLGVNVIYSLRAKTEERHLSSDPDYVKYALWIDQHGIFRFLNNWPIFKYYRYKVPTTYEVDA